MVPPEMAEDVFVPSDTATEPLYWSLWGGDVTVWPTSTSERNLTLRGYRKPIWSGLAGDELDGDTKLHSAIFHYTCSLAYAQLEDLELEAGYLQRWSTLLAEYRRHLLRPDYHRPLVLNGGLRPDSQRPTLLLNV
jgi:hypothetical protein